MITPSDTITIVKMIIDIVTESYIKPRLGKQRNKSAKKIEKSLLDYTKRTYEKLYFLKTIIYPNEKIPLFNIYYPLTIENRLSRNKYNISGTCQGLFNDHDRIIIIDYAGMGKSTLSKYIYLKTCEDGKYFPIFIELRKIRPEKDLFHLLQEDLGEFSSPLSRQELNQILSLSNIIILFDGFDETSLKIREDIIHDIQELVSYFPNIKYIITSRQDSALGAFSTFRAFHINKIKREQIGDILKLYDPNEENYQRIIEELDKVDNNHFAEFLHAPMMITLLLKSYFFSNEIPKKASLFYKNVFEALYSTHDLSKDGFRRKKKSDLDFDDFQNILRHISYKSIKTGSSYSRDELINNIDTALDIFGHHNVKSSDFLSDCLQAVPVFSEEGNEIRWIHRSLQDYFSAGYIIYKLSENKDVVLRKMFNSQRSSHYISVISLCHDIDPEAVLKNIILPFLKEYLNYYNEHADFKDHKLIIDNSFLRVMVSDPIYDVALQDDDSDTYVNSVIDAFVYRNAKRMNDILQTDRNKLACLELHFENYHQLREMRVIREDDRYWIVKFINSHYQKLIDVEQRIYPRENIRNPGESYCLGHQLIRQGFQKYGDRYPAIFFSLFINSTITFNEMEIQKFIKSIQNRLEQLELEEEF